jgi:VRR-NUC domain-containing protein/Fanconi-associated nuclease 1-like protein/Fanconi anemia protein nuclease-like protein
MVREVSDTVRRVGYQVMARRAAELKMKGGRPVLADPFYYLNNFGTVLESLESRYSELLTGEETEFIRRFAILPEPSRALLVRMIMRRGMFFRLSRLEYSEIGDAAVAAAPLLDMGWLEEPLLDVYALHRLLTKVELTGNLALSRNACRLNKPDLLEVLRAQHAEPRPFHGWCANLNDRVFRPVVKPLAERFRLMFFGNFHQDWTTFVLSDLGINSYEIVPVHTTPFSTRAHIDAFHQLYRCQMALQEGVELKDIVASIPAAILDSEWLEEHRQRLLFHIAMAYERSDDGAAAFAVYSVCRYRGSRMRTVRLLERMNEWQAARELCLVAASSPEGEAERQLVCRVLPRLNRKLGVTEAKRTGLPQLASFDIQLEAPPDGLALEFHVRDHLAREEQSDSTVHYVENGLISSLFGLLCWDAIFAPIPGAFFHGFQYGPADLESPYFYERRRERFAACFAELESGNYKDIIRERRSAKAGIQAPFVAWGLLKQPLLEYALQCFPAQHLRLWFEWIVRDIVENRAGFPDLVQFWPSERRYRMVEIKGPGDRLQDNQRRLLEFCSQHEMPVAVCRVRWRAH